jgi:hypothetical protein
MWLFGTWRPPAVLLPLTRIPQTLVIACFFCSLLCLRTDAL